MKLAVVGMSMIGTAALVLTGCSSDSGSEQAVGGMTECTDATMQEAVAGVYGDGNFDVTSYKCADGWAYVTTDPADGEQAAPRMFIFEAEGQFWIPKDAAAVCGTYEDGTYPADATIPESLYDPACLAG